MPAEEHGIDCAYWDNRGEGWRIECLCGWATCPNKTMAETGGEFDEHLAEEKRKGKD